MSSSLASLLLRGWGLGCFFFVFFFVFVVVVVALVGALFCLLILIRVLLRGVGRQEALLVEVTGSVLEDAVVLAIFGHALPRAQLVFEILLSATGFDARSSVAALAEDLGEELQPMSSAKRIHFSCFTVRVELALFFCF